MPTSRRSDSSGRMSPDRSSERNGSRPPPSYEKTRRSSRRRRFDERADPELRLEQRAERVAQQLLRLLRRRLEDHVLRDDDARQARDVGQELAQLVVVPDDLEAVPVRVEG